LRTEISQKEDSDVAAAALELSEGTTQLQAAFQAEAKIPRTTLFDYLTS
jgi:flagellin-like hook-associated protein FlgL